MPSSLRLFEKPEETPPGLDAIRAWLRKPRPRLRGVWIWIRWILSGIPAAYRSLKKNWPAARKRIRTIASEGEKVARGAVWVGHAARDLGGAVVRTTRAFRGPDGKVSGAVKKVREAGKAVRGFGGRLTEGGGGVAAAFSSVGRLVRPGRDETANGLGLLDPPEEREQKVSESPKRRLREPAKPSRPSPEHNEHKRSPERPKAGRAERSEPRAKPRPSKPESRPPAAAAPPEDPDTRFKGLPEVLLNRVKAVGGRPHQESFRVLILDICRRRDWTTPAELARWFDMHRRSLASRHIRPLLKAGLLERRFPDSPNSPKQAYRTRREDSSRPDPTAIRPATSED